MKYDKYIMYYIFIQPKRSGIQIRNILKSRVKTRWPYVKPEQYFAGSFIM